MYRDSGCIPRVGTKVYPDVGIQVVPTLVYRDVPYHGGRGQMRDSGMYP